MFLGHYGISFAARVREPRVSLGWFFLAVQCLDVLFAVFVMLGWERMRIVPGFTAYNPYDLYDMPWSHSLVAALIWSLLVVGAARGLKVPGAAALLLGLSVLSHFALDLPVHAHDLPVLTERGPKLGFGLWNHRTATLLLELTSVGTGLAVYWWKRRPGARRFFPFALALVGFTLATPFMPPPPTVSVFALQALAAYFVLAAWARHVDRAPVPRQSR